MGLDIRRTGKNRRYSLRSTVSDELLHEGEDVDLHGAKKALIERAFQDFLLEAGAIDRTFPAGYFVDGRLERHTPGSAQCKLELLQANDPNGLWKELKKKYEL